MAQPVPNDNVVKFRPREAKVMSDQPQLDDGYSRVVNALVEALAASRLTQHQHQVVWAIVRKTYGWGKGKDRISGSQLAEITGLTREECSRTLSKLIEQKVVIREGGAQSSIKLNTKTSEWIQVSKKTKPNVCSNSNFSTLCSNSAQIDCSNSAHTKDNKETINNTNVLFVETDVSTTAKPKRNKSQIPACPVQKIVDLYHEILPELPAVVAMTPKRESQIKARWKQKINVPGPNGTRELRECWNLEFWARYFRFIRKNKFLMGQTQPSKGYEKPFIANLEWLTNSTNFVNVLEKPA